MDIETKANNKKANNTGKQASKSAATQKATMESAIDCFVKYGYAKTTSMIIADNAGISRGAMMHHFPSKRKIVEATVEYLMQQRIENFTSDIQKLADAELRMERGIDVYWKHLHSKLFTAYHELTVAARTDPELEKIMRKATRQFEQEWLENNKKIFPEWADKGPLLDLAMDLTQFVLEGMALNKLSYDVKSRQEHILAYLKARLREIYSAGEQKDKKKCCTTVHKEFIKKEIFQIKIDFILYQ